MARSTSFRQSSFSDLDELSSSDSETNRVPPEGSDVSINTIHDTDAPAKPLTRPQSRAGSAHFDCALSTVNKAVHNKYSNPDDLREDNTIVNEKTECQLTLHELLRKEHALEGKTGKLTSTVRRRPHRTMTKQRPTHLKPRASPRFAMGEARSSARISSSTPSIGTGRTDDYLLAFVTGVPLDAVWYSQFKTAGFSEEKLHRLAEVPGDAVEELLAKMFPRMAAVDHFVCAMAIKALSSRT
ncbi:hypothetical protein B0H16DRAFT_1740002 [Mycena metata]|uniref:Uncharacterized protein n=1 Tax=Mycena metata TaxID=1033252 RepID=A0AAD7HED9_9AGAR|nr:hypothetical protein B0H16DRAFT_1740002 [Mycena metata]